MQYDPLDEDSGMGHRLYDTCNRLSSQFKTKFRKYEETLMTSPLGEECPSGFAGKEESGEESEEGLDEELDEELDVLLDREERRLEAKR
ncbi:hypothetical protein PV325_010209 [Microctonus aethiopoides]|nr:hypothetical protein PV325_010209 [Microctonus aethiopoides]